MHTSLDLHCHVCVLCTTLYYLTYTYHWAKPWGGVGHGNQLDVHL
jgi:hypothetical protein